jgi:hypothetical protein
MIGFGLEPGKSLRAPHVRRWADSSDEARSCCWRHYGLLMLGDFLTAKQ